MFPRVTDDSRGRPAGPLARCVRVTEPARPAAPIGRSGNTNEENPTLTDSQRAIESDEILVLHNGVSIAVNRAWDAERRAAELAGKPSPLASRVNVAPPGLADLLVRSRIYHARARTGSELDRVETTA